MKGSKGRTPKNPRFDSDVTMKTLWRLLYQDFGCPSVAHRHIQALPDTVSFRNEPWPDYSKLNAYEYKHAYQLESLFKRYIFHKDKYSIDELEVITNDKFLKLQEVLSSVASQKNTCWLRELTMCVRRMVKRILGPYDLDEHHASCRFGSKATVGNTLSRSYLDTKLVGNSSRGSATDVITGSIKQIKWFKTYLESDNLLSDIIRKRTGREISDQFVEVSILHQNNVPKSYKILRGIQPNTTIGSFYTSGLGRMIEMRLRKIGLDIRYLQDSHRQVVKTASVSRGLVTADLQSASHCFTDALINKLVPREWYNALKLGRIKYVTLGSNDTIPYYQESFMAMGIGFTFPLQTLLFYCIIKSVEHLLRKSGGFISVYGDDLIYPRKIHSWVVAALESYGFVLNMDKTYVEQHFRESCGSDFCRGIDVRPFQPKDSYRGNSGSRYLFFLYKTINGLLRRWDKCEVQKAYRFLILEILRCRTIVYQVPIDYPDYAGIKCQHFTSFDIEIPWAKIRYDRNNSIIIQSLGTVFQRRLVDFIDVYCWDWLRSRSQGEFNFHPYDTNATPAITWLPAKRQPRNYRDIHGKRVKLLEPFVPEKNTNIIPEVVTGLRIC